MKTLATGTGNVKPSYASARHYEFVATDINQKKFEVINQYKFAGVNIETEGNSFQRDGNLKVTIGKRSVFADACIVVIAVLADFGRVFNHISITLLKLFQWYFINWVGWRYVLDEGYPRDRLGAAII